jgi:glycosyltransferase involved in cell wall biosynthesis
MNLIFYAYSEGWGLTYHLTNFVLEISKHIKNFYVIHDGKEQNENLLNRINEKNIVNFNINEISIEEIILKYKLEKTNIIIHCQGFKQLKSIITLKRKYNITTSIAINAYRNGKCYKHLFAKFINFYIGKDIDNWLFHSASAKNDFTYLNKIQNNQFIIPLGIERFTKEKSDKYKEVFLNKEFYYNKDEKYVFYLAQFHKHKNHKELIDLIKPSLEKHPNLKLLFLGNGSLMNETHKYVKELKLIDNIHFLGRIDRNTVLSHLKNASFSIVLSKNETFGHNIIEPLSLNIPLVTTEVGVSTEVIKEYYNGFFLDTIYDKKFNKIIDNLVENKYEFEFDEQFYWENVIIRYVKYFRSIN